MSQTWVIFIPFFSPSNPIASFPLRLHFTPLVASPLSDVQGPQAVQVSKSVQSRQGVTVTSSMTPPLTLPLNLTSFVPFLPQNRVAPLNTVVSWHGWVKVTECSSNSMGSVQDGRASDLQTPSGQLRLKVLNNKFLNKYVHTLVYTLPVTQISAMVLNLCRGRLA